MNAFTRWLKFNLVGAIGMALQLSTLALLNHLFPGHYLLTTATAVELTLLHNFVWHLHYTWRDRRNTSTPLTQFLRFQLSTGLLALFGNLLLMRLLVHLLHLPVVLANLLAIISTGFLNFALSHFWTFRQNPSPPPGTPRLQPRVS